MILYRKSNPSFTMVFPVVMYGYVWELNYKENWILYIIIYNYYILTYIDYILI